MNDIIVITIGVLIVFLMGIHIGTTIKLDRKEDEEDDME